MRKRLKSCASAGGILSSVKAEKKNEKKKKKKHIFVQNKEGKEEEEEEKTNRMRVFSETKFEIQAVSNETGSFESKDFAGQEAKLLASIARLDEVVKRTNEINGGAFAKENELRKERRRAKKERNLRKKSTL